MSKPMRTPADEEARYAAVSSQITDLLDAAANTSNGMVGLGSVWLASEMYDRNETAHQAYYARHGILQALQQRIANVAGPMPDGFEQLFSR